MKKFIMLLMLLSSPLHAHEMTPTYPKLKPSHMAGVSKVTMEMFNKRADVEFYEIGVFDKDFNSIPFVSTYRILNIKYLDHVTFDVYIRDVDRDRATYVCSKSKLRKDDSARAAISSRICSKFK